MPNVLVPAMSRLRARLRLRTRSRSLVRDLQSRFPRQPIDPRDVCGFVDPPPVTLHDHLVDYSQRQTTPDQARIESVLESYPHLLGDRVLHVGIGNSEFALRFAARVKILDGLTISQREQALAESLSIPNYSIYLINKYSPRLPSVLNHTYTAIIDNNLASFACCTYHLYTMLDNYRSLLVPSGRVLTDNAGLHWRVDNKSDWVMSYSQLAALSARFGLTGCELTDMVYSLMREDA